MEVDVQDEIGRAVTGRDGTVFGWTIGVEIWTRDGSQWTCLARCVGPWIETRLRASQLTTTLAINGRVAHVFEVDVDDSERFLSSTHRVRPGEGVVRRGGSVMVEPGELLDVECTGVGLLTTMVDS